MTHLIHPYEDLAGGEWLRGNLHTHTTRSDGSESPQAVVSDYARRGYDFLALTDHDKTISEAELDSLDSAGMVLLPGNEVTANGPHLVHVGASVRIDPVADRQAVIDEAEKRGGLVFVAHPDWEARFDHCPLENLRRWKGYAGVEIFNGGVSILDEGSAYAVRKWEALLTDGRRVWGCATDDSHAPGHVGIGWDMVHARERTSGAILEALATGRSYASSGVVISSIQVEGLRIRIETENAVRIRCTERWARPLRIVDDRVIEVAVPETAPYVRFTCWGAGEQFAWTQPFWVGE